MKYNSQKKFIILFVFVLSMSLTLFAEDLSNWKESFIDQLLKNPTKNSPIYERTIKTIRCNDSDYIPKVPLAGKCIMYQGILCQIMHNGLKIQQGCYYEGPGFFWMTDIIAGLKGHHEPQEEKAFYEVLKYIPAGGTMLELGSYWAYYSLWFHKEIPNAKNYLIEGNHNLLCIGFKNFQLNDYVGNFFHGYVGIKNDQLIMENSGPLIVIDDFLIEQGIDHLDILHSDIQGAEYEMLLGSEITLKNHKVHYYFISTHSEGVHKDCIDHLEKYDYHIVVEHGPSQSCSEDGLIVARANSIDGINNMEISKY